MNVEVSRRTLLKSAAAAAGVLSVGLNSKGLLAAGHASKEHAINPFVTIDKDGVVTVLLKHFEMGQGTTTGLTTLVAEELDADWDAIQFDFAPADGVRYKNLIFGSQGTGGSTAIPNSWMQYRKAGAMARDLMVRAAAKKWGVKPSEISIDKGIVSAGSKTATFGDLVEAASALTPVEEPQIKTPDQFKLIGKMDTKRKDSVSKSTGTAIFATDINIEGMVYVAIKRSPRFGGKLASFDAAAAKEVSGFIEAKALPNKAGVAVYARNTWASLKARDAVEAEWDFSGAENRSSEDLFTELGGLLDKPEYNVRKEVNGAQAGDAIKGAAKVIEAEYRMPFLAHAPMEPLTCIVEATENGGVLFHDGCQFPGIVQPTIAAVLGLEQEQVEIKTVFAGGSFGRRATPTADYQVEAALAFDMLGRKTPVKLVWSREDDIHGGYYRPIFSHKAKIGLDGSGNIVGWDHRIAGKSIIKGTAFEPFMVKDGVDHSSVEGIADTLYQVPNMAVGLSDLKTEVPVLWWRAVGHTHTAYAMETLVDMAAREGGQDPITLRLGLLGDSPEQKRMANVIKKARDVSNWEKKAPAGKGRGFASHFSFSTYVAMVVDVTVADDEVHVDKVTVAVDCGVAINPDVIKAQMEGGLGFGLGAVIRNEITLADGEVEQTNFPDYEPLRINEMPEVEVHIINSNEAPTGVGEPGTPPIGPAVANAIFDATGKRITTLPMVKSGLDFI